MSQKIDKILSLASSFEEKAQSFEKKANDGNLFYSALIQYETLSQAVPDIAEGWRQVAENFKKESANDPNMPKIYDLFLKEASALESCLPQLQAIEIEIDNAISNSSEEAPETMRSKESFSKIEKLLNKFSSEIKKS